MSSAIHSRSPSQLSPDGVDPAFSLNAHHPSRCAGAASVGLDPDPCSPSPRGLPSSLVQLSKSSGHVGLPSTPSWRTVVGIAHHKRLSSKHWFCHALEPCVENVMEIDVRQKWRDHPALRRAALGVMDRSFFEYSRPEPFVDHATQHSVAHPLVQHLPEQPVVERVEETLDVHFDHPPPIHLLEPLTQRVKRPVCAPPRS